VSADIEILMLEEFDRLGEEVEEHDLLCLCESCGRFMDLGDLIREQVAEEKADRALR
jgi:hypothetical protein